MRSKVLVAGRVPRCGVPKRLNPHPIVVTKPSRIVLARMPSIEIKVRQLAFLSDDGPTFAQVHEEKNCCWKCVFCGPLPACSVLRTSVFFACKCSCPLACS